MDGCTLEKWIVMMTEYIWAPRTQGDIARAALGVVLENYNIDAFNLGDKVLVDWYNEFYRTRGLSRTEPLDFSLTESLDSSLSVITRLPELTSILVALGAPYLLLDRQITDISLLANAPAEFRIQTIEHALADEEDPLELQAAEKILGAARSEDQHPSLTIASNGLERMPVVIQLLPKLERLCLDDMDTWRSARACIRYASVLRHLPSRVRINFIQMYEDRMHLFSDFVGEHRAFINALDGGQTCINLGPYGGFEYRPEISEFILLMPEIERLIIRSPKFLRGMLDILATLPNLSWLYLKTSSKYEKVDLSILQPLSSLKILSINSAAIVSDPEALQGLSALRKLDLNCGINGGDLTVLRGLISLKELYIGSDGGETSLNGLENLLALESLEIGGGDGDIAGWSVLQRCSAIREVIVGFWGRARMANWLKEILSLKLAEGLKVVMEVGAPSCRHLSFQPMEMCKGYGNFPMRLGVDRIEICRFAGGKFVFSEELIDPFQMDSPAVASVAAHIASRLAAMDDNDQGPLSGMPAADNQNSEVALASYPLPHLG